MTKSAREPLYFDEGPPAEPWIGVPPSADITVECPPAANLPTGVVPEG